MPTGTLNHPHVILKILIVGALLVLCAFALVGLLYMTRGVHVSRVRSAGEEDGTPGVDEPMFCDTVALLTRTTLSPGHDVRIARSGDETYPALWRDLRAAERSITAQLYYCQPGKLADEFKEILLDRARAGVKVHFLADAIGAGPLPKEYFEELQAAGVHAVKFRPGRWYEFHKMQNRSHIRVVVVDGSVAWTGGFGLDDKWIGDGRSEDSWRDTNARFEGPAVLQHQATFAAAWAEATGTLLTGDAYFPAEEREADGDVYAGVLHAAPTIGSTAAERFIAVSIAAARRSLLISNAYFVPNEEQCRMLTKASQRGVDVRVLTCNREDADSSLTYHAGHLRYEGLLRAGVRIFEYRPSMMHAKTIVTDAHWCGVGTMNFDNRSMAHNDETMLLSLDRGIGGRLYEMFEEDCTRSTEMQLATFVRRPWTDKLREKAYNLMWRVL